MSQIKKLSLGGTPENKEAIKKDMWEKFRTLSHKDQRKAYTQYQQAEKLLDVEGGVTFKEDGSYEVHTEKLPEELKGLDWTGYQGPSVDKGFLGLQGYSHAGLFKGKEKRDAEKQDRTLSLAMADLSSSLNTNKEAVTDVAKPTGYGKVIPNFDDVITSNYRGSTEVAGQTLAKMTEDQKSKFYIDNLEKLLTTYKNNYETNKNTGGIDTYNDDDYKLISTSLENFNKQKATGSTKLADYQNIFSSLGISTEGKLKTEAELKAEADAKIVAEEPLKIKDLSKSIGLTNELATPYYQAGFRKVVSGTGDPNLDRYLSGKAIFLDNGAGKKLILNKATGLPFNEGENVVNDQFNPLFNTSFITDPNLWSTQGTTFGKGSLKLQDFGNFGKELQFEGNLTPGSKLYGWSDNNSGDYLGRLEQHINGKKIPLTRVSRGIYKDPANNIVNLNITGFGGSKIEIRNYDDILPKIPMAVTNTKPGEYDYREDLAKIEDVVSKNEKVGENGSYMNSAIALKWALINDPNVKKDPQLKQRIEDLLISFHAKLENIQLNKKGGIIKAEKGVNFAEYKKKLYSQQNKPTPTSDTPIKDISGTWKDQTSSQNVLDVVSTIGNVTAFIPGWGAIGAGVSFGSDLLKDSLDGKIDNWGTHALNAGFIGAAFIGLGGIKSLLKVGKLADKGYDVVKLADKASKLKVFQPAEKAVLGELKSLSKTYGVKTVPELTAKLTELATKGSVAEIKLAEKGLKTLGESEKLFTHVADASKPLLGSTTLGSAAKTTGDILTKVPDKISDLLSNNWVRKGARVAGMAPGLMAAPRVAATIYTDGIEYTRPEDFRAMAVAGAVGRNWYKDFKGMRAIERQTNPVTSGEDHTIFKLDGKEVKINQLLEKPVLKEKGKLTFREEKIAKIEEENLKITKTFKEDLITKYKAEGNTLTEAQEKAIMNSKLEDLNVTPMQKTMTGERVLGDQPTMATTDRTVNQRDYDLAKKYFDKFKLKKTAITKTPKKVEAPVVSDKSTITTPKDKPLAETKKTSDNIKALPLGKPLASPEVRKRLEKLVKLSDYHSVGNKGGRQILLEEGKPYNKKMVELLNKYRFKEGGILKNQNPTNKGIAYKNDNALIDWSNLKSKVDKTDLVNAGMFLNTVIANKNMASKQIAAATNVATKTLQPNQRIVIHNPYDRMAQDAKAESNSIGARVGNSYSDGNKQMAAKLEMFNKGEKAAGAYREKGTELYNKGTQAQLNADHTTLVGNIAVSDFNNASIKDGANKANLVEVNRINADNTAFNNLGLSFLKNYHAKKNEKDFSKLVALQTGKEYNKLRNDGELYSESAFAKAKEDYTIKAEEARKKNQPLETWENSTIYKNLLKDKDLHMKKLQDFGDNMRTLQLGLAYNIHTAKTGGTLTKQDKVDIERIKHKNKADLEEIKTLYKTILANNKIMQNSLIKVFK